MVSSLKHGFLWKATHLIFRPIWLKKRPMLILVFLVAHALLGEHGGSNNAWFFELCFFYADIAHRIEDLGVELLIQRF